MAREVFPVTACILDPFLTGEQGMPQWWEHSPPTYVVRISNRGIDARGWVCRLFSPLLREVFPRVVRFSPLLKNQHFQIPILYSTHGHVFSWTPKCFVGKQCKLQFTKKFSRRYDNYWSLHLRRWTRFSSHRKKICYCYYKYYLSSILRHEAS